MAQFVETIVRLIDDLDGTPGEVTIEFTWDAVDYVIDLNNANAGEFRALLEPYVVAARPRPKPKRKSPTPKPKSKDVAVKQVTSLNAKARAKEQRDSIRNWGRANGFDVSTKSRIAQAVTDAYEAAHSNPRLRAGTK